MQVAWGEIRRTGASDRISLPRGMTRWRTRVAGYGAEGRDQAFSVRLRSPTSASRIRAPA